MLNFAAELKKENCYDDRNNTYGWSVNHAQWNGFSRRYLLDTDICIAMVKGHKNVRQHIRQHDHSDLKISEITIAEMLFGAVKSGKVNFRNKVA